jgi:Zn-dependent protease with chaperone function
MTDSRRAWRLWLFAAGAALLSAVVGMVTAVAASTSTAPQAALARCWSLFVPRLAASSVAALLIGSVGFAVFAGVATSLIKQWCAGRRLRRHHPVIGEFVIAGERVHVFESSQPLAFTQGATRPRIHLSTGARERMTDDQLRAVVAHEAHHRRRRDPLRLLATRALGKSLFFAPAVAAIGADYARLSELEADGAAIDVSGTPRPLAAALLLFADSGPVAAAGFAPERVDRLIGRPVRFALPTRLLAAGLGASFTIVAVAALIALGGPDQDAARLPGALEQACILARALLPLAAGSALLALFAIMRSNRRAAS